MSDHHPFPERGFVVHEDERPVERWDEIDGGAVTWRTLLSSDRDPTRGITLGVVDLPGRVPTPADRRHRHEPSEAYYVLHGEGFVDVDGVVTPLRAGSAVHVPGGAWHRAWSEHPDGMRMLYAFPVDAFDEVVYEFE